MLPLWPHNVCRLNGWLGFLFVIWPAACFAESEFSKFLHIPFIREYAGIIISMLLMLLITTLTLLIKSRQLQRALTEKNQVLVRASQTITSYFDVVDKNILSISLNLNGSIMYVSTCFLQRYQFSKSKLLGQSYEILFDDNDNVALDAVRQAIREVNGWEGELLLAGNHEKPAWAEVSIDPIFQEVSEQTVKGFTLIFTDVTNQKMIRHLSETDALTGIFNRYRIDQLLLHELNRQKRYHHSLSVAMIDLDLFKPVNDTYGHLVGDEVLIAFVKVINANIRNVDIFGRWGGEEFILIIPETTVEQACAICEKLRTNIMDTTFPQEISLTASFGITACYEPDNIDDIINRADQALYQAKNAGRNCVRITEG